jgi:hypothetical protein
MTSRSLQSSVPNFAWWAATYIDTNKSMDYLMKEELELLVQEFCLIPLSKQLVNVNLRVSFITTL